MLINVCTIKLNKCVYAFMGMGVCILSRGEHNSTKTNREEERKE